MIFPNIFIQNLICTHRHPFSKQHMKTNNDCKCANTIYWDFICLGTQVCAVMHPEKYSFHIQGVFNGQKIDTAKIQKRLMRKVCLIFEYI